MDVPDYYEILGVHEKAEPEVIRAAYRQLMRMYHPDMHQSDPGSHERAKLINEAYAVLGDPGNRAAYDEQRGARGEPQTPPQSDETRRADAAARGPEQDQQPAGPHAQAAARAGGQWRGPRGQAVGSSPCPSCGTVIRLDEQYCGACGTRVQYVCPVCGELHQCDTNFCTATGVSIDEYLRQVAERQRQEDEERERQKRIWAERARQEEEERRLREIAHRVVLCVAGAVRSSIMGFLTFLASRYTALFEMAQDPGQDQTALFFAGLVIFFIPGLLLGALSYGAGGVVSTGLQCERSWDGPSVAVVLGGAGLVFVLQAMALAPSLGGVGGVATAVLTFAFFQGAYQ